MKKKQATWFMLMFCFWGLLFPELTFSEDALKVVYTEADFEVDEKYKEQTQWEIYMDFLKANPEQVKVKSKLLEMLKSLWD
jgi:hypothetical protein